MNDAGLDNPACPDGWVSKDKCYTCPDGIISVNNNVCVCSVGSKCVETPLKDSRDAIETTDDLDDLVNCDDGDCNDDCIDDACDDGVICINDKCYTCPNDAGIYLNDNGTCACTDGSACVEAPLKDSRDDDSDDSDDDSDDDGAGVTCTNDKCYTCPNGASLILNNNVCECSDGSKCVETPLKNSRDDAFFDDFDDDDCFFDDDNDDCDDDDGDGVICINGVCYTCPNGAGIYFNNRTCACTDGSACVEASPAI